MVTYLKYLSAFIVSLMISLHMTPGCFATDIEDAKNVMQAYAALSDAVRLNGTADVITDSLYGVGNVSDNLAIVGKVMGYPDDYDKDDVKFIHDTFQAMNNFVSSMEYQVNSELYG